MSFCGEEEIEVSEPVPVFLPRSQLQRLLDALQAAGRQCIGPVERDGALAGRPWSDGLLHAVFQAATCRTAGFNTIPLAAETITDAGLLLMILLMFFACLLKMFWRAAELFKRQRDTFGWHMIIAILISFVSFLIIGAIAFDFMRIGFKNMWFLIGCGIALYNIALYQARQNQMPRMPHL